MSKMFTVEDNCLRCGQCAELCVTNIISFENGKKPYVAPEKEAACIQCGQCVAFCPGSCCHLGFQPKNGRLTVEAGLWPKTAEAETLLRSRRSIRKYQKESLGRELILRVLETTRYAPSAANLQPVRWVITAGREQTMALAKQVAETFRMMCGDNPKAPMTQRLRPLVEAWDQGVDVIFRGAPHLAVALVNQTHPFPEDGATALAYFELAAHANGLGCCWAGFFTTAARQSQEIQKAIGLREGEIICGGQMFGRPQGLGLSRLLPPRKPIDCTLL